MVNDCTFVGRLGKDPKHDTSKSGSSYCTFSMAVDKGGPKKEGEEKKPLWLNVTCFGKTADFVGKYLKKGALVYIQGELEIEEYSPKDAPTEKRTAVKILANAVKSLEKKSDSASAGAAANAGAPAPAVAADASGADEDIPF